MNVSSHSFCFLKGGRAVALAAWFCLVFAAASCRSVETVTVEVPVMVHDTTYVSQHIHDSVYVENTEYIKGDTVYLSKTKYVEKIKTDTLVKYVEKPVEIVNEVVKTKYVEKELKWWQETLMVFGCMLLFVMVAYIAKLAWGKRKT